jgi:DNA-binding response OmpR family regulator
VEKLLVAGELAHDEDLARLCATHGYEVRGVPNPDDALALVAGGDVALVILCMHVTEDEDGVELLEAIRATDPRCEVILVSCRRSGVERAQDAASTLAAVRLLNADALDYLRQPIGVRQLSQAFQCARRSRVRSSSCPPAPTS